MYKYMNLFRINLNNILFIYRIIKLATVINSDDLNSKVTPDVIGSEHDAVQCVISNSDNAITDS